MLIVLEGRTFPLMYRSRSMMSAPAPSHEPEELGDMLSNALAELCARVSPK